MTLRRPAPAETLIFPSGSKPAAFRDGAVRILSGGWRTLRLWAAKRKQRARLAQLDDHMLRDIGVSRSQATREASRWFFD